MLFAYYCLCCRFLLLKFLLFVTYYLASFLSGYISQEPKSSVVYVDNSARQVVNAMTKHAIDLMCTDVSIDRNCLLSADVCGQHINRCCWHLRPIASIKISVPDRLSYILAFYRPSSIKSVMVLATFIMRLYTFADSFKLSIAIRNISLL